MAILASFIYCYKIFFCYLLHPIFFLKAVCLKIKLTNNLGFNSCDLTNTIIGFKKKRLELIVKVRGLMNIKKRLNEPNLVKIGRQSVLKYSLITFGLMRWRILLKLKTVNINPKLAPALILPTLVIMLF